MEELECAPFKEGRANKSSITDKKDMHANCLSCLFYFLPSFVLAIYIHQYMSSHPEPLAMLGYNYEKVSAFSW